MKEVKSEEELNSIDLKEADLLVATGTPPIESFDHWRRLSFDGIDQVGAALKPDDDWLPVVLIDCPKGYVVYPLPDPLTGQEGLAEVAAAVLALEPRYVCRVQMAWAADYVEGNDEAPSQREDKREILMAQIAQKGGEHEFWSAEVERDGENPPQIVKWELQPAAGPMAEAFERMMK